MAEITFDASGFRAGLAQALREMRDDDGAAYLAELAAVGVGLARRYAPVLQEPNRERRPGELRDSIEARAGRDRRGPFVEVGTWIPEWPFYVEFGTIHAPAQPFMRPMMAQLTGGLGASLARSARTTLISSRARKRATIRAAVRRREITGAEARVYGRAVGSRFRFRYRQRRRR
jgi:hypothetical protein